MPVGWRQEGAASGRRLHGRWAAPVSADTSVPKQREAAGLGDFKSWLPDAVLRDAPTGMAFLGTDKRFVWVNAALARMYGRAEADFTGRTVTEVWPAEDAARAEAALRQVLGKNPSATETFSGAPAGRVCNWFPVHGPDGALGAGLIVTDSIVTDGIVADGVVADGVVTDGVVTDSGAGPQGLPAHEVL